MPPHEFPNSWASNGPHRAAAIQHTLGSELNQRQRFSLSPTEHARVFANTMTESKYGSVMQSWWKWIPNRLQPTLVQACSAFGESTCGRGARLGLRMVELETSLVRTE